MKKHGFTVIEVSLVIAIAGLIFLMAFAVVPTLNRSQRDSRRRDDMNLVANAIAKYSSNNRQAMPNSSDALKEFLPKNFSDPLGDDYEINLSPLTKTNNSFEVTEFSNTIYVRISATCEGERAVYSNNSRSFAILYRLEGSGTHCIDN